MNMSRTQPDIRRHAPRLGENTTEILLDAGYEQAEIDSMVADGEALLMNEN
jgi:crotonobetainyl-CoA:carnitine CoA-transferase CaiB-like acyl-CoA transferase